MRNRRLALGYAMTVDDKKRARRHHILPQSYLRWFATEDKVYVLDFKEERLYRANIANAACVLDFYTVETTERAEDDSVEQRFLSQLEGLPIPIVNRIVKDLGVPKRKEWEVLANYVALMYVRGPWFRQIVLDVHTDWARKMGDWLHSSEEIWQNAMSHLEMETGQKVTIEFDEAQEAYKRCQISARIPRNLWVEWMMQMASDLVAVFQEMTPNLLYIPVYRDAEFVTGDMPIVAVPRVTNPPADWKWLRNADADLLFPIGPRMCLLLNYDPKPQVRTVSRRQVAFVNQVMAVNCTRIVISQKPSFMWLRERGTISGSTDELKEFVLGTPESGTVRGDSWSVLRGEP